MNVKNLVLFTLATVFMVFGCKKDSENFVMNNNAQSTTTNRIVGVVTDEFGRPISGASVKFKDEITSTDVYGVYEFTKALVGEEHNFITITKSGYFKGCRTFRTNSLNSISQETQLIQASFDKYVSASNGGKVTVGEVILDFPPQAIVYDATGAAYSGIVQIAVKHINPLDVSSALQMPGDLSASGEGDEIDLLRSYGMVYIEIRSISGEKLQIKEGKTVRMSAAIPSELLNDAPFELPMWFFNNNSGLWEKEGSATMVGNEYVGEVSHFSCWNYDVAEPSIILSGRLVDEDGNPYSSLHLLVSAVGTSQGGRGLTSSDGRFSGRVTKGKELNISINGACGRIDITQVGPLLANTKLRDIVVSSSLFNKSSLSIKGTFLDCNAKSISNGLVSINNRTSFIENGKISIVSFYCDARPQALDIKVVDRNTLQETSKTVIVTSDKVDLGTMTVCGSDADFIQIKNTNLDLDRILIDNLVMEVAVNDSSHLTANGPDGSKIYLSFLMTQKTQGTLPLNFALFNISDGSRTMSYISEGKGTITFEDQTTNAVRLGSYSVTVELYGTNRKETMTGQFRVRY